MHSWPGNARELKSAIDRMVILFDGPVLRAQWWEPPAVFSTPTIVVSSAFGQAPASPQMPSYGSAVGFIPSGKKKLEIASKLLDESDNNYSWVSAQLGINVSTLYRWRKAGKVA